MTFLGMQADVSPNRASQSNFVSRNRSTSPEGAVGFRRKGLRYFDYGGRRWAAQSSIRRTWAWGKPSFGMHLNLCGMFADQALRSFAGLVQSLIYEWVHNS